MKKNFLTAVLFFLLLATTNVLAATPSETTEAKLYMVTPSDHTLSSPADFPVWAELYNVKKAYLYYRMNGEQDFFREEMKPFDWDPSIYGGIIPAKIFETGYVEYFVEIESLNGVFIKGPLQNAKVVMSTVDDDESIINADEPDSFYDIEANNGKLPNGTTISSQYLMSIKSPVRKTSDTSSSIYPDVSSKMMELRTLTPNPHNGIDLATNVDVYPAFSGKVTSAGGTYGVVEIGHDFNNDGNIDFYSRYVHMTGIGVTAGQYVTQDQKIGTASNVGTSAVHLDFSFFVKNSGVNNYMSGKYFYQYVVGANWNSGLDIDFVQPPINFYDSMIGTGVKINAYPKGTRDSSTLNLTLYYRIKGTSAWSTGTMTRISGTNDYRYYFGPSLNGKTVEYYVKVERSGVNGYVTRPMAKGSNPPLIFYTVSVRSIQSIDGPEEIQ